MLIRAVTAADLPGILTIYNEVVASSTAIYSDAPSTIEERQQWFEARLQRGYPVLVAVDGDQVLGFTSYGDFRSWPGYAYTVEHSVHVHSGARGRGIGRALVEALVPFARSQGKHVMIGAIDAENLASLRFHERLGFEPSAVLKQVGRKFDRWLDLVFVQRIL